jgi:hypothetical protein
MKKLQYKKQLEHVKANDVEHERMMCWYASELEVTRSGVASRLEYMDRKQYEQLLTKYKEQIYE